MSSNHVKNIVIGSLLAGILSAACRNTEEIFSCENGGAIRSKEDIVTLDQCQVIGGSLLITNDEEMAAVELDGHIFSTNKIEGSLVITGTDRLKALNFFPQLKRVDGSILMSSNSSVSSVSLDSLESIGNSLAMRSNAHLTTISLKALKSVSEMRIRDNNALEEFTFSPKLTVAGDVDFSCNGPLPTGTETTLTTRFRETLDASKVGGTITIFGPNSCSSRVGD